MPKFSLISLLQLFISIPIAFIVASIFEPTISQISNFSAARNSVLLFEQEIESLGSLSNLSQDEDKKEFIKHKLSSRIDPWGNPLQFYFVNVGNGVVQTRIYSFGRDGYSNSKGNDVDDINSWDEHNGEYYLQDIRIEKRKSKLLRASIVLPFVFLAIFFVRLACCKIFKSESRLKRRFIGDPSNRRRQDGRKNIFREM